MPEQALYLKWRPLTFGDVVGQEHITRTLRNSIKTSRIRHAYLFSGPRGTGKTTSARLLAKAVNCLDADPENRPCNQCHACVAVNEGRFLDLIEIDAASHTGVDDVRDLRDRIAFAPNEGRYKVYIIDEVHRFSGNAFDALLKTLEEPPDHALFVLATTEIDRVPATIKSRCLPFEFRRLSLQEVTARLQFIAEQESLHIEPAALELIAREGTGSVRDSISLLDQIVADPEETITLELTQRILGTASLRAVRDLVAAIAEQSIARGLQVINEAIDAGSDPRQFGKQVVEHLRSVLLAQTASPDLLEASQDDRALFAQQAQRLDRSTLLRVIRAFNEAITSNDSGWQPQLALELALIEGLQPSVQPLVPAQPMQGPPQPQQAQPTPAGGNQARQADMMAAQPAEVEISTGEPGVVPIALVKERWNDAKTLIFNHSHNASEPVRNLPHLMDHAQPVNVEGNLLTIGVLKAIYVKKLEEETRLRWVERAISNVTNAQLRIRYVVVEDLDLSQPGDQSDIEPIMQDLLKHGGQIRENDD